MKKPNFKIEVFRDEDGGLKLSVESDDITFSEVLLSTKRAISIMLKSLGLSENFIYTPIVNVIINDKETSEYKGLLYDYKNE